MHVLFRLKILQHESDGHSVASVGAGSITEAPRGVGHVRGIFEGKMKLYKQLHNKQDILYFKRIYFLSTMRVKFCIKHNEG